MVVLLFDDVHPLTKDQRPGRRHPVDPTGLTGLGALRRRLDEPVLLELRQRPVDRRPVDVAEAERLELGHERVPVGRLLGE